MSMSLTRAKAVAKNPEAFSTEELDDALSTIVDSDRLSERQVTNLQNKIDPVLRARLAAKPDLAGQFLLAAGKVVLDTVDAAQTAVATVVNHFAPKGK